MGAEHTDKYVIVNTFRWCNASAYGGREMARGSGHDRDFPGTRRTIISRGRSRTSIR